LVFPNVFGDHTFVQINVGQMQQHTTVMSRSFRSERTLNALIWACLCLGLVFLLILATAFRAHAQWPTDPNDPLVICNASSYQKNMRLLGDGSGGWYVLWTDDRLGANNYAVFGQRMDADGDLLWEPNGRLIMAIPGRSINYYGATRMNDDRLFLAYTSGADQFGADTLRAMAFDGDGQPDWSQPVLLAQPGLLPGGGTASGHYYPRVTPVRNGIFVGWGTNLLGAADYVHVARILNDGTNLMPVQGVEIPSLNNSIVTGPWAMRHDMNGGLMLEERWGNGAGAPLYAMRVDSMGNERWPALLQVSANSGGLAYEWSTAMAPDTRMNTVWGYGYDLRMSIYDTSGVLLNTSAPLEVCLHPDVQENPFVVQAAEETTVFWADNRAALGGGRQVFMQRFDTNGVPLLANDGILAVRMNGNINGFPRAFARNGDEHVVAMVAPFASDGAMPGFRAGCVTSAGTNLWSDTTRFCTGPLSPNGGSDYALTSDGHGGAMAVWFNWQNDAIYAARIDSSGYLGGDNTTSIIQVEGSAWFHVYPNPANELITMKVGQPGLGAKAALEVWDATGRLIFQQRIGAMNEVQTIHLSPDWKNGIYMVKLQVEGHAPQVTRVSVQR